VKNLARGPPSARLARRSTALSATISRRLETGEALDPPAMSSRQPRVPFARFYAGNELCPARTGVAFAEAPRRASVSHPVRRSHLDQRHSSTRSWMKLFFACSRRALNTSALRLCPLSLPRAYGGSLLCGRARKRARAPGRIDVSALENQCH